MANNPTQVLGGKEVIRKLKRLGSGSLKAAEKSLFKSGQRVVTKSKRQFVPVDTGTLRSTLRAHKPRTIPTKRVIIVVLSAGGPAAPYAAAVHETNKNYRNGRRWKYLETPAKEEMPEIVRSLGQDLNKFIASVK